MIFKGLIIGLIACLVIGLGHPLVIKTEYYYGAKAWPAFLVAGCIFCIASLFVSNDIISATLGIVGFTLFWCIKELKEQEERVAKGWFPANPDKKK